MLVTIKEYAKNKGVTYEAVRRQLKQYAKDLDGHVIVKGKTNFLDDVAIQILDKHRTPKTVVVDYTENEMQAENERLRAEIDRLKSNIIKLQNEKMTYLADKTRMETLLAISDKEHDELSQVKKELAINKHDIELAKNDLANTKIELENKTNELSRFNKTIFGLYKKI